MRVDVEEPERNRLNLISTLDSASAATEIQGFSLCGRNAQSPFAPGQGQARVSSSDLSMAANTAGRYLLDCSRG